MAELPSGTVTFLFTDLEGSTRLWEEFPESMRGASARHDEILRDAIESHSGYVVKTMGDGVHAVFRTARDALDAAVVAQLSLSGEQWGASGPLKVRMGLHTCEADVRDGDYYGSGVNRAARLMATAHGGQIVLSHATEEVARDALAADVEIVDLGEHQLRDLARAERVFQLCAPGLAVEFPRLRSLDAYPGNLPLQVTSFIGRDDELRAVAKELDTSRLVTVIGVGGVGKTRLALQVAADVLPRFPDGGWVCELAVAEGPETMLEVVAATLGVKPRPGVSLDASIIEFLRAKRLLIVLDNCEHLLRPSASLVVAVLRGCPGVVVIATSREGLGVAGEQIWPLASLAVPESTTIDAVRVCEAVRLFLDRAHAARPGFALSPSNATAVAEICRRLDGIPLAIELAAARVAAMSPADISGLLDERFRLLTGGRRSSVERHQTLRATVDWSYWLLEDSARTVFDRLGVFTGAFDVRAAQRVVAGDGIEEWGVLDALSDLVAKSMITAEETAGDTMRYQLLETLRQYARERLDESGDSDRWRSQHAAHYAAVTEEAAERMRGSDELVWKQRLFAELDNVRAALAWSLDREPQADVEYGLRIVVALFSNTRADLGMALADWAERAAGRVEGSTPDRRVRVLVAAANTKSILRGDPDAARALALDALRDESASPHARAAACTSLSTAEWLTGHLDEARRWTGEASRTLGTTDVDDFDRIGPHTLGATQAAVAGDQTMARAEAEAGLRLARLYANPSALAVTLWITGLALESDNPNEALVAFEESAELARGGATDVNFGATLVHIARLRARNGDTTSAIHALDEAVAHFERLGPRTELVVVIAQLSRTLANSGHAEAAAVLAGTVAVGPLSTMTIPGSAERMARATAPARAQLGEPHYETAFARGAAMSYEEAITYARNALDVAIVEKDEIPE